MALNPSIILQAGANPPQFQSPIDTFQKGLALREMMNRAQLSDLQTQQQQQQINDQQSLRTLLQQNPNPTAQQIYGAASPMMATQVVKGMTEARQAAANLQKTQGDLANQANDFMGKVAGMVRTNGYSGAAMQQALQLADAAGYSQQANAVRAQLQQNPQSSKQVWDGLFQSAMNAKDQATVATDKQKADAATLQAQARAEQAATGARTAASTIGARDVATVGQLFGGAKSQADWDAARQRAIIAGVSPAALQVIPTQYSPQAAALAAQQAISPGQAAALKVQQQQANIAGARLGIEQQRANIEKARFGMDTALQGTSQPTATGDASLQGVSPAMAAQIRAIANYQQPPYTRGTGIGPQIMAKVMQYDPTYDATQYQAANGIRQAFTRGKEAQQINALNTAIQHLGELKDKADALNNTPLTAINAAKNWFKGEDNDSNIKGYNQAAQGVAMELNKAYGGTGEGEVNNWLKNASPNMGPAQQNDAVQTGAGLLFKKINAFQDQWSKTPLGKKGAFPILSPQSKATLQRLGIDPTTGEKIAANATVKMQAPDGSIAVVPANLSQHYQQLGAKVVQ